VGAGTGSYERSGISFVAVEPSSAMLRQRPAASAPAVCASATALPISDHAFDATLAILTLHHWPDLGRGLGELRRVARRKVVVLTFDPDFESFWLVDYFPELADIDCSIMPPIDELRRHPGRLDVTSVPIPHDCIDGFLGAYWRRPEVYLKPDARAAISSFSNRSSTRRLASRPSSAICLPAPGMNGMAISWHVPRSILGTASSPLEESGPDEPMPLRAAA
jgi:SAM-dependent methyltransferase